MRQKEWAHKRGGEAIVLPCLRPQSGQAEVQQLHQRTTRLEKEKEAASQEKSLDAVVPRVGDFCIERRMV